MCAQFTLKIDSNKLSQKYKLKINEELGLIDSKFLPHSIAPVVVKRDSDFILTPMRFSLVPSWSKEPKVKFATHNARIETITEKPTWRLPFQSHHCLVPITSFYESAYDGPFAGHIIEFKESQDNLLFAAGIFDYWKDKNLPENSFFSFSILTQEPSKFILDHGHDRTPIFLKNDFAFKWLEFVKKDESIMRNELLKNSFHPEFKVEIVRPLKAGWEKRK